MFISKCINILDKLEEGGGSTSSLIKLSKGYGVLAVSIEDGDKLGDEDLFSLL